MVTSVLKRLYSDGKNFLNSDKCLMSPSVFSWYALTISAAYFLYDFFVCVFLM